MRSSTLATVPLSLVVLLAAAPLGAQITSDSAASGSAVTGFSVSWTHTVGNGANRILVVGLASYTDNPFSSASSVTYGGRPLTRQVVNSTLFIPNAEIWTLVAPVSGTATITATFPSQLNVTVGGSVSFSGVDQGTPVRASNSARISSGGGTLTIATSVTSATGDVVIDAVAMYGPGSTATPAMGQTVRWSGPGAFGSGSTQPGAAGSTTMTWTSGGLSAALAAIALIPAQADLSITKTLAAPVVGGQNVTYTITVTNNGPSQALGVTVNDVAPPGFTFVSNSGGCTTAFPCNLGTVNANQSVTINTTFSAPANFQGTSNTATVSSTTPDPNQANNAATVANSPPTTPIPPTLMLVCLGLGALVLSNARKWIGWAR